QFGAAVAAVGANFVVGAPLDDTGATDAGSAYLINGTTGAVVLTVRNPSPAANDQFRLAVRAAGWTVFGGAPLQDVPPPVYSPPRTITDAGAAYLFDGSTGTLLQTYLDPDTSNTGGDHFGAAVLGVGTQAVIAAPFETIDNATN